jgi:predicted DsbA family dithiol-disulfide isomerase
MAISSRSISVDVVSDVVCPWCYIGQKRLDKAISAVEGIEVGVRWRPFQLDPSIPPEGVDHHEYLVAKFGDPRSLEDSHARLTVLGQDVGIDYRFDLVERYPNTLDAHRLVRWAGAVGRQRELVDRLFEMHFTEGRYIGDHDVLAELGAAVGLDPDKTLRRLETNEDLQAIRAEIEGLQRKGVTGVPCFILADKWAVVGAQPTGVLVDAIRQVAGQLNIVHDDLATRV